MQLPHALLLDLDDTILAYESLADPSWRQVCHEHGAKLGIDGSTLHRTIMQKRQWFWNDVERATWGRRQVAQVSRTIVAEALTSLGVTDEKAATGLAAAYRVRREEAILPIPGAVEALAAFRSVGCRLALLTNGAAKHQRAKIDRFNLSPCFDTILIEEELGYGKPDPRVFESALARLSLTPQDAWMVGDNLVWDIGGAQSCGIFAIWVDAEGLGRPSPAHPVPPLPVKADRTIRTLAELAR